MRERERKTASVRGGHLPAWPRVALPAPTQDANITSVRNVFVARVSVFSNPPVVKWLTSFSIGWLPGDAYGVPWQSREPTATHQLNPCGAAGSPRRVRRLHERAEQCNDAAVWSFRQRDQQHIGARRRLVCEGRGV